MEKLLLIKKVYSDAFQNLGSKVLENGFKIYFWIYAMLFVIVFYAFIYRLSTGFIWN